MPSEKIVTADVVEILDSKMHASTSHPAVTVGSGDTYDSVLTKLENYVITIQQRAAMAATLSSASTLNPIVLKDDIPYLYGSGDLGSIKDSVPTFADLPLTENTLNDLRAVTADRVLYRWIITAPSGSSTNWAAFVTTGTLDHTQLVNYNSDLLTNPSSATPGLYRHLTQSEKALLLSPDQNHVHTGPSGDNLGQLNLITDKGSGVIITALERARLPASNESAAMQPSIQLLPAAVDPVLNTFTYPSHGFVLDNPVRFFSSNGTLPSPLSATITYYIINTTASTFQVSTSVGGSEVDLLTAGTRSFLVLSYPTLAPSGSNRLVTNVDPRLNTIRNPYITFGPSLATPPNPSFFGQDITDLIGSTFPTVKEGAIPAVVKANGTAWAVKALEILPNTTVSPSIPTSYYLNALADYSPISITPDTSWTFLPSNVNVTANTITMSSHPFRSGQIVYLTTTGSLPGGLTAGKCYGVTSVTASSISLYSEGDGDGVPLTVNTTSQGSGVHTLLPLNALLMESLALRDVIFSMQTGGAAVQINSGTGAITIVGIVFEIRALNTYCVEILRDGVIFEECEFRTATGEPLTNNLNGPAVNADNVTFRRCSFTGSFVRGLTINGDNCRVEECVFSLGVPTSISTVEIVGAQCQIDHCFFNHTGKTRIHITGDNCQISSNQIPLESTIIVDEGSNTRILSNLPQERNQPFYGTVRTVGMEGSYADYRGNDRQPFVNALSDPLCSEVLVLGGSYTFATPVSIPSGKSVRAAINTKPTITGTFYPTNHNTVEGLAFTVTTVSAATANYVNYRRCSFNTSSGWALRLIGNDILVEQCVFTGISGVNLQATNWRVLNSLFQTSSTPLQTVSSNDYGRVEGNVFLSGTVLLSSSYTVVRGNYFANTPSKLQTSEATWLGNISALANNATRDPSPAGIDQFKINLENNLEPLQGTGAARDTISGVVSLAFVKGGEGTAVSIPIPINASIPTATSYAIDLSWSAPVFSGTVVWEITCTFRDRVAGTTGTPSVYTLTCVRSKFSSRLEDTGTVTGNTYGGISSPTHVAVKIRRLSMNVSDTMHGTAHLTGASITFAQRD